MTGHAHNPYPVFSYQRRWVDGREVAPRAATFNGRPIVIIDPYDDAEVRRLADLMWSHRANLLADLAEVIRDSLHEYVAPSDPHEPVEVFEHLVVGRPASDGARTSLCSKVWKPDATAVATKRCPECVAIAEKMWSK